MRILAIYLLNFLQRLLVNNEIRSIVSKSMEPPVHGPVLNRLGKIADSRQIADFMVEMAWETEQIKLDPDTVLRGVKHVFLVKKSGFYVVAEIGNKIIGCMMITYEWSDWRNANQWWIQSVYVKPEHRRGGVFRLMYEFITELALEEPSVCGLRLYVEKDNTIAQDTYRSLGMDFSDYLVFEAPVVRD